ncbi:MAG: nucleotidyltransferase domain-containing protein [Oscillospiraceae bacterium]|nr:nucleotidyltransferase domain-containing protein [Oscillospiraceae bacterium]
MRVRLDEIKTRVTDAARLYPCITRVGIFGSYVRGTQKPNSDIDLLYAHDEVPEAEEQIKAFITDVRAACDACGFAKVDFASANWLHGIKHPMRKVKHGIEHDVKESILSTVQWFYPEANE